MAYIPESRLPEKQNVIPFQFFGTIICIVLLIGGRPARVQAVAWGLGHNSVATPEATVVISRAQKNEKWYKWYRNTKGLQIVMDSHKQERA